MHVVIHPGFMKTATTTLQEHFFSHHAAILNLAEPYTPRQRALGDELKKPHGRFSKTVLHKITANFLTDTGKSKSVAVISDEELTMFDSTRLLIPERLHALYPDATILFTIRNQIEWVKSFYAATGRRLQPAPAPYANRYVSVENWLTYSERNWHHSFLSSVDYDKIVGYWEKCFGRKRIHILMYEDLITHRELFVADLMKVLGLEDSEAIKLFDNAYSNVRPSWRLLWYHRLRDLLLPRVSVRKHFPGGRFVHSKVKNLLHSGGPLRVELPAEWETKLVERYRDGNQRLTERYGLPLEANGYPL